jgi:AcrR family transcriptional regulator
MDLSAPQVSRKEQIEREAALLFKEKGYSASSMRDLAHQVGIEAGSLYSHFKSKESILQKICFNMANSFFKSLDAVSNLNGNSETKLKNAIHAHIAVLTADPDETIVFQNEWKHMKEPHLGDFMKMRKQYEDRFRKIIRQGIAQGEFLDHDADIMTLTLLSSLNNTTNWYNRDGKLSAADIAERLSDIFLKGLNKTK